MRAGSLCICRCGGGPDGVGLHGARAAARKIRIESTTRGKQAIVTAQVFLPSKRDGKVPAMIIMHGSGGVREKREVAYAREFNAMGVAAVVIDSFSPRGIASTVRDQSQ